MLELAIEQAPEVEHLVVGEELDVARVRRRRDERRVQVVEPVRAHGHAAAVGVGGDAAPLGDAAAHRGIGLQDLGAAGVDQLAEAPAADLDLAGRDRHGRRLREARMQVDRVGQERLLDPVRVVGGEAARVLERRRQVGPAVVDVEHEDDVGADRGARRGDARFLGGRREAAGLHLHRLEAELDVARHLAAEVGRRLAVDVVAAACIRHHLVALHAAEVVVQGQLRGARVQVPDRRVEDREAPHDRAGAALQQRLAVHVAPEAFAAQAVLADQHRREQLLDRHLGDRAAGAADVAEAEALDAVGAAHLDDAEVALVHGPRRERRRPLERHARDRDVHRFDSCHGLSG